MDVSDFYPRSPCGERRLLSDTWQALSTYFYPRSPCGERPAQKARLDTPAKFLSTLSLRRATWMIANNLHISEFLSTLSLRRATPDDRRPPLPVPYFYPRSPCGERRGIMSTDMESAYISIHALLAESDPLPRRNYAAGVRFLSTLSLRRATKRGQGGVEYR